MGLLDDAIREHLDLKRRRGADPAEVERLEREALGPVRRNRDPGEAVMPEDQVPPGGEFAYDQDEDGDWAHQPQAGDEFSDPGVGYADDLSGPGSGYADDLSGPGSGYADDLNGPGSGYADDDLLEEPDFATEEPAPPAPEHQRVRPESLREGQFEPARDDWARGGDDLDPEPFPTTQGSRRRPFDDPAGDETTEYRVDEEVGPHHDEPDEDMLEETPEFLQDTPDHDRLWFEQRPPRDFDFDG